MSSEKSKSEREYDQTEQIHSIRQRSQSQLLQADTVAKLPQYLTGLIVTIPAVAAGTAYGWSSPVIVKLSSVEESPLGYALSPDSEEISYITSILVIGSAIAPFFGALLADRIGRKYTLLISAIFYLIAYVLFIFANQIWFLYVGRLFQGFGNGFVIAIQPPYMGEIGSDETRGALGSFLTLAIAAGSLYIFAIAPFVSYLSIQLACLAIPIAFIGIFYLIPDSPAFYVSKGRHVEAEKALKSLGRHSDDRVQKEMAMIQLLIDKSKQEKGSVIDIFRYRANLKAFIICFGLITTQMASGLHAVQFYTQSIFDMTRTNIDSALSAILLALSHLIASGLAPFILNWCGRKSTLLVSIGVVILSLLALGLFFFLDSNKIDTSAIAWLPLTSMLIYFGIVSIGLNPIPFTIIGEIFVPGIKAQASSILATYGSIVAFVESRWFTALTALGAHFAFWLFAVWSALGFIFVIFAVFETKGLSLKEIQDRLDNKHSSNSSSVENQL